MNDQTRPVTPYQLFMLALCVLVLISLAIEALVDLDPESLVILFYGDTLVCFFFLADFLLLLYRAPNRWKYLATWGWLDLVSSIPAVGMLRAGRAARMGRILRLLRGARSTRRLGTFAIEHRAQSTVLAAVFVMLLAIVFSSIGVLHVERGAPGSRIDSGADAFWWAVVTVSTVGYGDEFPVTAEGRFIASLLIVISVAMLSILTAFVATWFLEPDQEERDEELSAIRVELAEIRRLLESSKAT